METPNQEETAKINFAVGIFRAYIEILPKLHFLRSENRRKLEKKKGQNCHISAMLAAPFSSAKITFFFRFAPIATHFPKTAMRINDIYSYGKNRK